MSKVTHARFWPHDQKWDGEGGTWIDYIMELHNEVTSKWENAKKGTHRETLLRRVKRFFSIIYDEKINNKVSWDNSKKLKEAIEKIENKTMSKISIKPLADRVVIEPLAAETKTASGIYIPDSAKEKPQQGKVMAVGKGTKDEPTTVKVGDSVLYGKYAGTELKLDGGDYLIMRESDIFAIL